MPAFLAPLFLAGAVAVALPIVLHLLKRQPEARVKFAAVRFLRNAPVEQSSRRRLRELLLLALRVTALVLLSLAFARPFFASGAATSAESVTIVALDTSLSVSAPERFARARQLARNAVQQAPASHAVGVIAFSGEADVAAPPSTDRGLAVAAIDRTEAGFGRTRYRAALSSSLAAIESHAGSGRIVIVTDLQASGWREGEQITVPANVEVHLVDLGALPPNLAVTAARLAQSRITVSVRNVGEEARDARVQLTVDGRAGSEATVRVPAGQMADVSLTIPSGREAIVRVEDPGGLPGDDERYLMVGGDARRSILVVTASGDLGREAFFVQQGLLASRSRESDVQGVAASLLSTWDRAQLQQHAAVILLSTRGLDRRGRDLLRAFVDEGGGLMMAAGPGIDAAAAGELFTGALTVTAPQNTDPRAAGRTLVVADARHPVFRAFTGSRAGFGGATFDRIAVVSSDGCQTLARFTTGEAALVECPSRRGRTLVFASDLDRTWNDFPRHASFVAFVNEAVAYVGGDRQSRREYFVDERPAGVPARPGFAELPPAGTAAGQRIAINVDPEETVPERLTEESFRAPIVRGAAAPDAAPVTTEAARQEARQQVWWFLLAAMVAVLIAESWVAARTA